MSKVTSKLQVTLPKAIARAYRIEPGDEIEFEPAGEVIRVVPPGARGPSSARLGRRERLRLFDAARERQRVREASMEIETETETQTEPGDRGWTREELYTRGEPR